jgi:cathepsin F
MKEFLGVRIPHGYKPNFVKNYTNDEVYIPKQDTPDIWNWAQQGAVSSIKDQGSCGSCWTFSTVGNI